jgi:hypothetical protein
MSLSPSLVTYSGAALEALLVWRLVKGGIWRHYPCFSFFVGYVVSQHIALFAVFCLVPREYPAWYWGSGAVHMCLRFLLVWEVFRQTFPKASPLQRMVSRQAILGTIALISISTGMLWAIETYGKSQSWYLAMERSFGFVQAVLILAILTLARYYHSPVGRNIWGIAVAFGMYSSLTTAASALFDLMHSSFFPYPYWHFLSPFSFVAMLGMWTWAVWTYAPNPIATANEIVDPAGDAGRWADNWGRAVSTARKVLHP